MVAPHLVPKDSILTIISEYIKSLRNNDTQKAFSHIREMLDEANSMLNTTEPWKKA